VIEPAQRAAIAALDNEAILRERVARLARLRDQVRLALLDRGWRVPEAQGNFLWLATGEHTAAVAEIFLAGGIVTRPLGQDGVRVSIGESQAVDKLLRAAEEVVRTLPTAVPRPGLD
jgi:histidinol-phosphate aminotransferase